MHSFYRVLTFALLILASSAFAQGPGGYNPIGPGVDLAGNWGHVVHEDAHERGPGPEFANYIGLSFTSAGGMYGMAGDASCCTVPGHRCGVVSLSAIYQCTY